MITRIMALLAVIGLVTPSSVHARPPLMEIQSLDGSGNNLVHPDWGKAGTPYSRLAPARYADGIGAEVTGPAPRYISNRIFNDTGQPLFSSRHTSQWIVAWGQFVDHTFALRADSDKREGITFDNADPMESFHSDAPSIPFARSRYTGGETTPREQINTLNSYIDAYAVYGDDNRRLEWMREGPVDGNMANNSAKLLLSNGFLPRRTFRGDPDSAPVMDNTTVEGLDRLAVAGDFRANENTGLLAVQTLFAREHNRIVDLLPKGLSEEEKFQIARRVVIATQQYITYNEFLPTLGIRLPGYRGYNPAVNPSLATEFATAAYRIHSMVPSDFTVEAEAGKYSEAQLNAWRAQGVTVARQGTRIRLGVPPSLVMFNPDLVEQLDLGPILVGLNKPVQRRNDEMIDNLLRSLPISLGPTTVIFDITSIDIQRGRDHGLPSYNDLRRAVGLPAKPDFRSITGEATEAFPTDPLLTPGKEIDDPNSLDFLSLRDINGKPIPLTSPEAKTSAVAGQRRTTTAARLKAIYGDVSTVDAFVGMISEPLVPGTEFGELQLAIWQRQFGALRDGDRFFYLNDPALAMIRAKFGIDYRRSLGDVIAANTGIRRSQLTSNVFLTSGSS
ncbi:peroxidase family protein [Kibdelosporangium philippinense]|uniref:Peroxidase family protein n=1 Tax=Kibdelosporangium philippinense TaxID=211113 RepID=A0ABS8Z385_9PSEU|nr:peroxidase family protein [Kibdelosporangium philippinense]MCE7002265.1 peroxidase family protein [Kibdelosporangium philippinense]